MREIKIYTFEELSEEAKRKAIFGFRNNTDYTAYLGEVYATLEKITEIFRCDFSVDCFNNISFSGWDRDFLENVRELKGVRAYKYIYNNFIKPYQKGKYYSKGKWIEGKYQNKSRYSRIILNYDCPLTGVCYDMDYFNYFNKIDKHNIKNLTVFSFIKAIKEVYKEVIDIEEEYQKSDEYITDLLVNNDYEFFEDGKIIKNKC